MAIQGLEALTPLVEVLVDSVDEELRERVLLEATFALRAGQAAAIWKPVRAPDGLGWHPQIERGPSELLPAATTVRALLEDEGAGGGAGEARLAGARILRAGTGTQAIALVVGGVREETLDSLEALLSVWSATLSPGEAEKRNEGAWPQAPLPRRENRQKAHDFCNLLTSIRTNEDLIEGFDELDANELESFTELLDKQFTLAGDLLASALGEGHSEAHRPTAWPVGDTLDAWVRAETLASAQEAALELHASLAEEGRWRAIGLSPTDLERVVRNLVLNAREAGARRVWLEAYPSAGPEAGLVLRVQDDGPGIPRALLRDGLFADGVSTKERGSGFGLASCATLVEGAGGSVRARNVPDGGARFELFVPYRAQ